MLLEKSCNMRLNLKIKYYFYGIDRSEQRQSQRLACSSPELDSRLGWSMPIQHRDELGVLMICSGVHGLGSHRLKAWTRWPLATSKLARRSLSSVCGWVKVSPAANCPQWVEESKEDDTEVHNVLFLKDKINYKIK